MKFQIKSQGGVLREMDTRISCHQCNSQFHTPIKLSRHLKIHAPNREKEFKCKVEKCGKKYYSNAQLKLHCHMKHSSVKKFECNLCERTLKTKEGLHYHVSATHCGEKPYPCGKCSERFAHRSQLKNHQFTHTDARPHHCSKCPQRFKQRGDLNKHDKNVHQDTARRKRFKCSLCPKYFLAQGTLARHFSTHSSPEFRCYFCKKEFIQRIYLEHHTNTHTDEKPYFCPVSLCKYSSAHRNGLRLHAQRHHPTPEQAAAPRRMWPCYFCSKQYTSISHLGTHVRNHTKERHFFCSTCRISFKTGINLKSHIAAIHPKEKPFTCPVTGCNYSTAVPSLLREHGRRDHPQKFLCYFCKKEFPRRVPLELHLNTHTEEKPYICSVESCHFSSAHPPALNRHRRQHHMSPDQALPISWPCYFCSKHYTNSTKLGVHMGSHTLEKPYPCPLCEIGFTTGTRLRRHISSHTKEKPFKCTDCRTSFSENHHLSTHVAAIHRKKKRFFCNICNFSTYYKPVISRHIASRH